MKVFIVCYANGKPIVFMEAVHCWVSKEAAESDCAASEIVKEGIVEITDDGKR